MSHPNAEVKWIQTYTGRRVNPMNVLPSDIHIVDIAHSLANQCRFAGHTLKFYSVAEHSVQAAMAARVMGYSKNYQRAALLHDAEEAYLPDMCRPTKEYFPAYLEAGERIQRVINGIYNILPITYEVVKEIDQRLVHTEARKLMGSIDGWYLPRPPFDIEISCLKPKAAKAIFLGTFADLWDGPNG